MTGDDDMGQHIIPINKTGPQDIFIRKKKTVAVMCTRNHVWYTPPLKPFIPVVKSTPQPQV